MQKREQYIILKKSLIDEHNQEMVLAETIQNYFLKLLKQVIQLYKKEDTVHLYQVEQIILGDKINYQELLLNNIHDYYITASENSEAKINNTINQNITNKALQNITKTANKNIWDDLIPYEEILENYDITDLLRTYTNTNNAIQQAKNPLLHRIPTPFTNPFDITEIFEYEVDQAVVDYMSNNVFIASERTLERVTQEVYDIIKDSYAEEGKGVNELTNDIWDRFTDLSRYEAERIGRTETLKAQGSANYQRLLNNPAVEYKQWVATNDERTRDSHAEQDGQITFVDGTFANGCQYEGDTNADIEEWINCRCETVAYVPDVGMTAPVGMDYWFEDDMVIEDDIERYDYMVEVPEYIPSFY